MLPMAYKKKETSNEIVIKLFEGEYATGADFAAAMDALY